MKVEGVKDANVFECDDKILYLDSIWITSLFHKSTFSSPLTFKNRRRLCKKCPFWKHPWNELSENVLVENENTFKESLKFRYELNKNIKSVLKKILSKIFSNTPLKKIFSTPHQKLISFEFNRFTNTYFYLPSSVFQRFLSHSAVVIWFHRQLKFADNTKKKLFQKTKNVHHLNLMEFSLWKK